MNIVIPGCDAGRALKHKTDPDWQKPCKEAGVAVLDVDGPNLPTGISRMLFCTRHANQLAEHGAVL